MKNAARQLIIACCLALVAGCSSVPDEKEIAQAVHSGMPDFLKQSISIENLKKINGMKKDDNTYVAEIEYDIIFKESLDDLTRRIMEQAQTPLEKMQAGAMITAIRMSVGNFEKGQRRHIRRRVTLVHTENGWEEK